MTLEVKNISVLRQGSDIVKDASLSISPGKVVGLIGANGAGKTTILRAIAGFIKVAEGSVCIDDLNASALSPREKAKKLAYIPQGRQTDWPQSVRDVIALGRFPYQGRFGHLSERDHAIIEATIKRFGLQSLSGRPITELSGGEKAMVLLARALCVSAPYLLADEPTASLDPARQLEVMEHLRNEAQRGTGILIVLHDLTLASRFMDHVVIMHKGRIIAEGPPPATLTAETLEYAYGVSPLSGIENGESWLIPWKRL